MRIYVPPPPADDAPQALAALERAPGPSPWYLERPGTELPSRAGPLRWRRAGDANWGKTLLLSPGGSPLAVADFECYVRSLQGNRLLVWHAEERGAPPVVTHWMRFRVLDADALAPIDDLQSVYPTLGPRARFHAAGGELASVTLSTALDDGTHEVALPEELRGAGELLVLAHSTAGGLREDHFDEVGLRLWLLDPDRGRLEIVPQEWFNGGAYDFGYQWVTRVAREPHTGAIVGEGVRLGVFRLDRSMRRVERWLVEDVFYRPKY